MEHRKALQANVIEYFSFCFSLFVEHTFPFHHLDELGDESFVFTPERRFVRLATSRQKESNAVKMNVPSVCHLCYLNVWKPKLEKS